MNELIKKAILNGELILFLGAGASRGCRTVDGADVLDGLGLASFLAEKACIPYEEEELGDVYAAVRGTLEARLDPILEKQFRNVKPSSEYETLAQYSWRRIYTLNIDDGLERAFVRSQQHVYIRLAKDPIEERDQFFNNLDVVKLNGSIGRLTDGIIFSSADYASATNCNLPWYEQCASDFVRATFLFVGTKLNEPLLKFHIEKYKALNGKSAGKSYVITPTATAIQRDSLQMFNIEHVSGTLSDFTNWLRQEFPDPISPLQLVRASLPQYAAMLQAQNQGEFVSALEGVCLVTRDMTLTDPLEADGAIKSFYKGFQPTWRDIVDGVPAELDVLHEGLRVLAKGVRPNCVIPFIGPAGSGKSTLLMQLCYSLAQQGEIVYFLQEPPNDIKKTIEVIEQASGPAARVIVAIDNIDIVSDRLAECLQSGKLKKTTVICAERESLWVKRTRHKLGDWSSAPVLVREFSENDAKLILAKLEIYGSWTVLGQMAERDRIAALVRGANKQLLIALMEATFGRGFENIIESDYRTLASEDERLFFLTVGIVTERHFDAPVALVDRALNACGVLTRATVLTESLAGIVFTKGDRLVARHPVYVRHLLEHVVDPNLTARAIQGLLQAFAHYRAPVIKHLNKSEASIYKGIINHRFLWEILKGRETLILSLYKNLEKSFELDGLFWLQYGLALRDLHDDEEALEKLRVAVGAYPMPHTLHALGQQLLILGEKSEDKKTALAFAEEARAILEPLDDVIDSDDTYPIVTLAEGHTKLMMQVEGKQEAQSLAKSYWSVLKARSDQQPNNVRVRECYERLFKFAATGTWVE